MIKINIRKIEERIGAYYNIISFSEDDVELTNINGGNLDILVKQSLNQLDKKNINYNQLIINLPEKIYFNDNRIKNTFDNYSENKKLDLFYVVRY